MKIHRVRFTVGRMMAVIASVALILVAVRKDYSGFTGILIVASCIGCLTHKLSTDTLAGLRSKGFPIGRIKKLVVILGATGRSSAIVLASDFVFLVVYWSYWALLSFPQNHFYPHRHPEHIAIGSVFGSLAAISVASRMRRLFCAKEGVLDKKQPSTSEPATSTGTSETVTPKA